MKSLTTGLGVLWASPCDHASRRRETNTLSMLALAFLAVVRSAADSQERPRLESATT
ncbi:MAG TPA: hypothetical protein PKY77_20685 [Phycisphaerae bacterium]|nr:hypothetical protein [Phycisphaerae bacterium]HRY70626.1 hypothetical protein [Phycisphaerae bacterium]HSA28939.1 hypothetical protein [Phycisphaerae bacterium]